MRKYLAIIWTMSMTLVVSSVATAANLALPDFTELVEENSGSVVKIVTESQVEPVNQADVEQLPELFRYFFGDQLPEDFDYQAPQPSEGLGSGFIISEDGYILTNNHVVSGADKVSVRMTNGDIFDAEVVGTDPGTDIAVLKIEGKNLPVVEFGDSDELKVGEWVLAIGSPFNFEYSVTAGIVSAKGRALGGADRYVPFIQTDVAINPGNSGGPLFNLDGKVVGINSQIYTRSGGFMGVSFAIPINIAMKVAKQLQETGEVQRGWLGVEMYPPFNEDLELARSMGLERADGALIARVFPNSPAEAAGLKADDVLIEIDGHKVRRYADVPPLIGAFSPGDKVDLTVIRGGDKKEFRVVIGSLSNAQLAQAEQGALPDHTADNPLNIIVSDVSGVNGVRVEEVQPGPAQRAGMRKGDIITMMRNEFVESKGDFDRIVSNLPKNGAVAVRILRGNNIVYLAIPTH
ncbi:DegQ family serine endoprotease [Reinekea marinisedimentorum]|uniref:Probable periplasmic serine endoprotease DegP-like n=1 Tax=Reinekea marinisedimentorum TaxID=230495 RepID=A0A4R3I4V9_9GAMM|nr:DegQ family serine endoprotease [Reinekea marinisedimentorum]TCS39805.1 serine protease Do [Reinekea marinisedimentorum]